MKRALTDLYLDKARVKPGDRLEVFDKHFPGFGARITTSKVSFYVVCRIHGKQVRHTFKPGWPEMKVDDARDCARRFLRVAKAGGYPRSSSEEAPRTVAQLQADWMTRYAEGRLSEVTLTSRRVYVRKLDAVMGTRDLEAVTHASLVAFLDTMDSTRVMQNRVRSYVIQLFAWAVQRGYLQQNPAANLPSPSKEKSRARVLSDSEVARVGVQYRGGLSVWRRCAAPVCSRRAA